MALQDRIFSLETEYAISFYSESGPRPGAGTIVDVLIRAVSQSHGLAHSGFLVNGSRLAHDVGHAEWSLPECRTAREAAAYDKAADHLFLETVGPRAEKMMLRDGFKGRLAVTKNNADSFGNSYGSHENYQMKFNADLLMSEEFIRYMVQAFVPFLVSRPILAGSGWLNVQRAPGNNQRIRYELSQRAPFVQAVVARDTTQARPIFNLGREGESFTVGNYRRLHLIMGDANLSGWATWLKLGSTGLMIRLVEDLFFDDVPALRDPVAALKTICANPASKVPLQNGDQVTALDLQWMYYDLADAYLNVFGASQDDEDLMEAWGKALEDFERDPMRLRDRADWAIKRQILETFLQPHGLNLNNPISDRALVTELQALDLRYHELTPEGLYTRLYPADTLLTAEEIKFAENYPPPYTRAHIRGEIIRLARECGLRGGAGYWTEVALENERLATLQSLEFDHPRLAEWDRPWARLEEQVRQSPDNEVLRYNLGRCYQSLGWYQKALGAFQAAVERKPDRSDMVRDLATTLLLLGQYEEAVKWFEKYNQLVIFGDDDVFRDDISIGDAYRLTGDDQKATQAYRKATRATSSISALAYSKMALMHLKRGEIQSAETYFNKSLQTSAERLVTWVGLGAIGWSRGEHDQARAWFQDALALSLNRATVVLTESAARYFQAVAQIGLEQDGGLDALKAALDNQTAEAADGVYAIEPLITLLAGVSDPPKEAQAARALASEARILVNQPDPADSPLMLARRWQWLNQALHHANAEIRLQAIRYTAWRLDDGPPTVVEKLAALLVDRAQQDHDPRVRRAAVKALGHLKLAGMNQITDDLIKCLQDESPVVRWAAEASLDYLSQLRATSPELVASVSFGDPPPENPDDTTPPDSLGDIFDTYF